MSASGRSFVFALLALALSACAARSGTFEDAFLFRGIDGLTERRTQRLIIEHGEHRAELLGVLELADESTSLAVLNAQGLVLFSVRQTATGRQVERHPDLPEFVDIDQILDDVRLINWPTDQLRAALSNAATLRETKKERRLLMRGKQLCIVRFEPHLADWQRATLQSDRHGYTLTVQVI